MYHPFSITPSYTRPNWLLPPFYSLPPDLIYTNNPGVVITKPSFPSIPHNNPPVLLSMLTDSTHFSLPFSPESIGVAQQSTHLQHKLQHLQPQTQQSFHFRHKVQHPLINANFSCHLQKLKRKSAIKCDVCKVHLNSRLQATQHFNGKNHLRIINKLKKMSQETSTDTSSTSSDIKNITCALNSTSNNVTYSPETTNLSHETEYLALDKGPLNLEIIYKKSKITSEISKLSQATTSNSLTSISTNTSTKTTLTLTVTQTASETLTTPTTNTSTSENYLASTTTTSTTQPLERRFITKPDADSTLSSDGEQDIRKQA